MSEIPDSFRSRIELLERQNEALRRIPQALTNMDDADGFLRSLCDTVTEVIGATWATFITFDLAGREIQGNVMGGREPPMRPLKDFEEATRGLTGWVIANRRPALSSGRELDPREAPDVQEKRQKNGAGSLMVAPLVYQGNVLGTVTAGRMDVEGEFQQEDLDLLEAIAHQAAIAVHTQDLYAEQRRKTEEREVLLQEIHHRVKNNLSLVISLARLHQERASDQAHREDLEDLIRRVHSMALIHEQLLANDNLGSVDVRLYLQDLSSHLEALGAEGRSAHITVEADPVALELNTLVPLGLITTELLLNALKHGFPKGWLATGRQDPEIHLSFTVRDDGCVLEVTDNGAGVKSGVEEGAPGTGGLGFSLVNSLAEQLHGTLEHIPAEGTGVRLRFPCSPDSAS